MAERWIYDPDCETIHIHDLINMAKDSLYVKDKLSDYLIGMLIYAFVENIIPRWTAELFQVPFREPGWGVKLPQGVIKLRQKPSCPRVGKAFLGPDRKVLTLLGRELTGSGSPNLESSPLTQDTIKNHPNYQTWLNRNLYAGRNPIHLTYIRVRPDHDNKLTCDGWVNYVNGVNDKDGHKNYEHGPNSTPP